MDYRDDHFEWNQVKAASNLRDHKVSFGDARLAFNDPNSIDLYLPDDSDWEERWKRLCVGSGHLLAVIYTEREGDDGLIRTRLISAWKANAYDQASYNAG